MVVAKPIGDGGGGDGRVAAHPLEFQAAVSRAAHGSSSRETDAAASGPLPGMGILRLSPQPGAASRDHHSSGQGGASRCSRS